MQILTDANGAEIVAQQRSTLGPITISFFDASGAAVTPTSITWTLRDKDGNVINNRDAIVVTPAASIEILLAGDDLDIGESETLLSAIVNGKVMKEVKRYLGIAAVYTSTEGTDLPLTDEAEFPIRWLVTVDEV